MLHHSSGPLPPIAPARSVQIQVTGYTDRSGSPGYNQRLSERRAAAVADALTRFGVPRNEMTVGGRGENDNRVPDRRRRPRAAEPPRRNRVPIAGASRSRVSAETRQRHPARVMFAAEARWVGERLAALPAEELSPLLNVGSGIRAFREPRSPGRSTIFRAAGGARGRNRSSRRPRRSRHRHRPTCSRRRFASGRTGRYRALLCCNVLEHVRDPGEFARRCAALVTAGRDHRRHRAAQLSASRRPDRHALSPYPGRGGGAVPGQLACRRRDHRCGKSYADEVRRRPWLLLRPWQGRRCRSSASPNGGARCRSRTGCSTITRSAPRCCAATANRRFPGPRRPSR